MNHAYYSLRRTLPIWKFEPLAKELLEKVSEYAIDEVIVKLDAEEFFHGHPSLDWAKEYQPKLIWLRDELAKRNVRYSLNPWVTVGQCDRGRNDREKYPEMQWVVGHDGIECNHCVCHLSEGWRKYVKELWSIYAATKPHLLWIEDDIRSFNHEPVRFGCFCPLHMKRFSQLVGREVSREELVRAMLKPEIPHPWRELYLKMQQEVINETVEFLAKTVHAVSPDTCMGLMSSGPREHVVENRDWMTFAEKLADGRPFYSRPPMDNYNETGLTGLYYSQDSIKLTRSVLPQNTIEQTEVESVPFTRFSKSTAFTFTEIALSYACGAQGVTLNLFDHTGSLMSKEEHYGQMLSKEKKYLNALAEACQQPGKLRGIRLYHNNGSAITKQLSPDADYHELAEEGLPLCRALEALGIATNYRDDQCRITVLAGQTVRAATDAEIRSWLSGGLLLDATAAKILWERGYGQEIGLKQITAPARRRSLPLVLSAEQLLEPITSQKDLYLTCTLPWLTTEGRFSQITPLPNTKTVSQFVDPDCQKVAPSLILFENSLGGRVAIHAMDYESAIGVSFLSPERKMQFHWLMTYLGKGTVPLLFTCDGAYVFSWRKDGEKETVLGAFNFNLDDWNHCSFQLHWENALPEYIKILQEDGTWTDARPIECSLQAEMLTVQLQVTVTYHRPLVLKIIKE